ncbi:MAG: hypothetical protein PHO26_04185 [Dehalococcoidia bacterium]|nr:hypothetical protein [Dehalococcoidia bacterium]MDD5493178.1 hypothetical protein [Dehalococcoidia bacterium]
MAGGETVELAGYRFKVIPQAVIRRLLFDFLPYFQAGKPRFALTITRIGESTGPQEIYWAIRFSNGDETGGVISVPELQKNKSHSPVMVGGKFLGYTGDTLIILPEIPTKLDFKTYRTLYAFNTTQKTWLALTITAGLIAGTLTALLQWLICLLN